MIRVALIGCGRTVRMAHAPALQALGEHYQVVAVGDADREALDDAGILLKVPPEHRYTNYRDLLFQETFDLVDITLPHAYHYEAAREALSVGAHLVTERPLALNLHDAEELLKLAEAKGKLISVLHYYLYFPPFQEAIRQVRAGAIGKPFFIRCEGVTGGFGAGTASYHPAWHNNAEISGGGVWMVSGYHAVYLCMALMGARANSITTRLDNFTDAFQVDDTVAALISHAGGGISSVQAAWSVPAGGMQVFEIYGAEGAIVLGHDGHPLGVFANADSTWRHPQVGMGQDDSVIGFFRALAECLHLGAPPPVTHRDALDTLEVILAGYQANERGGTEDIAPL